jgi:uncharacterized damage-inducible protein DinB
MKWFDRSFDRGLPAWMAPNLLERLRGTPARLEDQVAHQLPERLTGTGSRWSAQENIGHLLDLEPLWSGRVEDVLAGEEVMRAADLQNRATHEAGHDSRELAGLLSDFRGARMQLVATLADLEPEVLERTALHPRLRQPMSIVDLMHFVAEHDDHHLAEISRLLD